MQVRIDESWRAVLQPEFDKPYFEILTSFVRHAYTTTTCYPPAKLIFHAFDACPFDKVRVVILGQDPYHEPAQAEGWAFSVPDGVRIPPSLENIYKELQRDLGIQPPASGHLARWVEQGVLLLNATLTVEAHKAVRFLFVAVVGMKVTGGKEDCRGEDGYQKASGTRVPDAFVFTIGIHYLLTMNLRMAWSPLAERMAMV